MGCIDVGDVDLVWCYVDWDWLMVGWGGVILGWGFIKFVFVLVFDNLGWLDEKSYGLFCGL